MKVVVAQRGARDAYQVALGLQEAGLLDRLVTDLYWPGDRSWAKALERRLGAGAASALRARMAPSLDSSLVSTCMASGLSSLILEKVKKVPFPLRQRAIRATDNAIGNAAGRRARQQGNAILSYSYYGYSAFSRASRSAPKILFQLHPHPSSMRRILGQELQLHPECAVSLSKEWELSLPPADYRNLVEEVAMAEHWLAASSFTKATLTENGVDASRVHVIPYGVNLDRFKPGPEWPHKAAANRPLRLLFVGTINQRKGISYLLEAIRQFPAGQVELLVCGRAVDNLALFQGLSPQVNVRISVTAAELTEAYRWADLFVFPSIAEGFAHVLLEAMASGLPVLSTTNTAAPDLITDGLEGFVVPPRRPDLLVEKIRHVLTHRDSLPFMAAAARGKAETFTWARFRSGVAGAVQSILAEKQQERKVAAHV